ncbi:serine/arginine repetitive matrix protein 1-like [Pyrus ussuriensis x Pyrus communis]|uniref:Serine/arginine repetitive matrix protein 1-like n=1 Tax=Pyrus ussuriensis x Pyrus communis TaxID=2448454 RepID=A0A5N5GFL5_9ROSA|nr:serine/arginine repetitive matrix protein 1-like [Pyrus ussuriensis x Pyrus communis]
MGCCLSTTDAGKSSAFDPQKHRHSLAGTEESRSDAAPESRAPPPIDEETVKEVLSETPKPKHSPQSSPPPLFKHEPVLDRDQGKIAASEEEELPVFVSLKTKIDPERIEQKVPICNNNDGGEVSELSEICSLSESMSGTTVTRDDDEEVHQRFVNRSPVKLRQNRDSSMGQRRDRVVGKSPSRITESSPGRRYGPNGAGSVRLVRSREPSPSQQPMSRRGSRPESNRREPGESSGRRSRSPATRVTDGGGVNRANVGRSPSARKSGKYPGLTTIGPIESSSSSFGPIRRVAEEPKNGGNWPANESLDNPHVSLECFIFL